LEEDVWEDLIAIGSRDDTPFEVLAPAAEHQAGDTHTDWSGEGAALQQALERDTWPLPLTKDREGYYGPHHFSYWASGFRDSRILRECCTRLGVDLRDYLDFGCASGRVVRHFATHVDGVRVTGCDINRRHVEWVTQHLPSTITAFQNHSIPTLPLPDESLDLVSAYSVFTHVEALETAWLMELRRILRPGGIAWVTVHTERTWASMAPGWPLYQALVKHPDFARYDSERGPDLPKDRLVFRWRGNRSYTSNVFYTRDYIARTWGRIMDIAEEHHRLPGFQDVVVLRKP
jgi:SAM-dependent methyltransferase